jgi:hypothetical protein
MDIPWTQLKTFALTKPVLYGAPSAAVLGIVLGLVFRVGPQIDEDRTMEPFDRAAVEETATPIAWPAGKVPDYVIGTDFVAMTKGPRPIYLSDFAPPPLPEPVSYAAEEPASPPPPPVVVQAERRWPSSQGDILSVALPEDAPPAPKPAPVLVVAAAAPSL